MTFQAIIFDCDGVLVNSEELGIKIELAELAKHGLDYSREEFIDTYMGLMDAAAQNVLEQEFQSRLGRPAPDAFNDSVVEKRLRLYEKDLKAVDGVFELMSSIDVPKAVASSSLTPILNKKLIQVGLDRHFDRHIYSGDQVDQGKPAPDLFIYTAEQLGVSPEKCLVIEDSINGVLAGVAAGMTVWGFLGGGHLDETFGPKLRDAGAVEVFGHFSQIETRLTANRF